jgi:pyruvate carboxylase
VVGDLAIFMLTQNLTPETLIDRGESIQFPESVVGFFAGDIGIPPGGFPERLREIVLKGRAPIVVEDLPDVDFAAVRAEVAGKAGLSMSAVSEQDVLSYLMYPRVFTDFAAGRQRYSDFSPIPTDIFFYGLAPGEETEIEIEPGKTLIVKLVTLTAPDEHGVRALFYELNGNPREVRVRDRGVEAAKTERPRADPANLHHLGAPTPGAVAEIRVKPGDAVEKGDHLLTLEAMKVLMHVNSPLSATVKEVVVAPLDHVEAGDLLMVFE